MFDVQVNLLKNRMFLTVSEKVDLTEMQAFINSAQREVNRLHPGFGIVSDISRCDLMAEEVRQELERFMKTLKENKKGTEVRVVNPVSAMVSLQWQRSSWKAGYTAENVTSVRDAERKLDEVEQKGSINMSAVPA